MSDDDAQFSRGAAATPPGEALKDALRLDLAFFDIVPDPAFVMRDGTVVLANPAAVRQLGGEDAEQSALIGRDGAEFVAPEHRQMMLEHRNWTSTAVEARTFGPVNLLRADGAIFQAEGTTVPCEFDGAPALLAMIRDVTERVRSSRALERHGSQLEAALRLAQVSCFEWNLAGSGISWADEADDVLGVGVSRLLGTIDALIERVLPAGRETARRRIDAIRRGDATLDAIFELANEDDSHIVLEVCGEVRRDDDTGALSLFGTCRNITEQSRTSAALRRSEERFRNMIDCLPESIRVQAEGEIVYANQAAASLLGADDPEQLMLAEPAVFYPDADQYEQFLNRPILGLGEVSDWSENTRLRMDGGLAHLESARIGILWEGRPAELVISRDIGARKRTEAALRENESRLRSVIANVPGMVYERVLHPDGEITFTFMNKASLEISGIDALEIVENPTAMFEQIHPDDRKGWLESITKSAVTLEPVNRSFRIYHRERGLRWLHATSRPRSGDDGSVIWDSLILDITEQKQTEEELARQAKQLAASKAEAEKARDEAERASEAKSNFLATMSHEIRTPMNGVLGMINVLLDLPLSLEQREQAQTIKTSGEELLGLLNDILDLSKVEAGKLELEEIDFRIDDVLQGVRDLWEPRIRAKGIEFDLVLPRRDLPVLRSDPGRIRQVLFNLVSNATKFTDSGRISIKVSVVSETDDEVQLRFDVIDTGIGIPEETIREVFGSFTQADSSTTRRFGGSGLGLAICRNMVRLLGGRIEVESAPGAGSRFWFVVRCRRGTNTRVGTEEPASQQEERVAMNLKSGLRVLVAEDNHINQTIIRVMLAKAGHTVDTVANGVEAVSAVMRTPYDLVMMDIQMPEMDGVTAMKKIRALAEPTASTPIIAVTANAMKGDRETYLEAGMDEYVSKPIDIRTLYEKIAVVTSRSRGSEAEEDAASADTATRSASLSDIDQAV